MVEARGDVGDRALGLDDDPAPPLQLGRELRCGHATERLLDGREPPGRCRGGRSVVAGPNFLQQLDERVGLVAREPATGLALREPHRPARITKVGVARFLQEAEQFLHLTRGGGGTRRLPE